MKKVFNKFKQFFNFTQNIYWRISYILYIIYSLYINIDKLSLKNAYDIGYFTGIFAGFFILSIIFKLFCSLLKLLFHISRKFIKYLRKHIFWSCVFFFIILIILFTIFKPTVEERINKLPEDQKETVLDYTRFWKTFNWIPAYCRHIGIDLDLFYVENKYKDEIYQLVLKSGDITIYNNKNIIDILNDKFKQLKFLDNEIYEDKRVFEEIRNIIINTHITSKQDPWAAFVYYSHLIQDRDVCLNLNKEFPVNILSYLKKYTKEDNNFKYPKKGVVFLQNKN